MQSLRFFWQLPYSFLLYTNENIQPEEWNLVGLANHLRSKFFLEIGDLKMGASQQELRQEIIAKMHTAYQNKEASFGPEELQKLTRIVLLRVIDAKWKDHLYSMDFLRDGIGLRGYAGHDPLVEYQREGYDMFSQMIESVKDEALEFIFRAQVIKDERVSSVFAQIPQQMLHPESARIRDLPKQQAKRPRGLAEPKAPPAPSTEAARPFKREGRKIGRNEPCPCGSGKKYKRCCGKDA